MSELEEKQEMNENVVSPDFYELIKVNLTPEEKDEFENAMSLNIKSSLNRPLSKYKKEEIFLRHFFNSIGKFKKVLSYQIIEKFYDRYFDILEDLEQKSILSNKLINILYEQKKNEDALQECIKICKKDIKMNINEGNMQGKKLPALKKLIIINVYLGNYQAALNLCDTALSLGLVDDIDNGYGEKKNEILIKMGVIPASGKQEENNEIESFDTEEEKEKEMESDEESVEREEISMINETPLEETKEEITPEEISDEIILDEKISDEKNSDEKISDEKISDEKISDEKISDEIESNENEEKEPKTKFEKLMMKRTPTWIGALIILVFVALFVSIILIMLSKAK